MEPSGKSVRCAALVGPQGSGKTTLLQALIARAGAEAPALDASAEAKAFSMTTEPNLASCAFLDDEWAFIDCPGSAELMHLSLPAMQAADIVIIVAEPAPERAANLGPYFRFLDAHAIPHVLFVNKIDDAHTRVRDLLEALQAYSERTLVLRQTPIREGDKIVGAIDLVSERAWKYREGEASELVEIPAAAKDDEAERREVMLDAVADFNDDLMEQILEDKTPPSDEIFEVMTKELREDLVVPVLLGSGLHGNGVTRLFKLLRHEAPNVSQTAERRSFNGANAAASVIRTAHIPHAGKVSVMRVWRGALRAGDAIEGARVSNLISLNGDKREKIETAPEGAVAGLARMEDLSAGDVIVDGKVQHGEQQTGAFSPVFSWAIRPKNDRDDVKLSTALNKLAEEDPALSTDRRQETGELILRGQGDVHLRLAAAKLKNQYNVDIETAMPKPSYRETIRANADHHARHKKQSGGHGQFADIKVRIKPLGRGDGFAFSEEIHGGSVPKQFIPAVEAGVKEGLDEGPLGFPVVDIGVTLYDGQHHAVDSNEMSFKLAGRQAMREALPECDPVLLEPIYKTEIYVPSEHTSKAHGVISGRRGQILGFDAREGWPGWDVVTAMIPEPGLADLIIELRSLSQGAATFRAEFDHYQELFGKDADKVVLDRKAEREAG
ncbi:MAG: elongation factor G [Pseudomonadota bacterium]